MQGPKAHCWLKNPVPNPLHDTRSVSGLKQEQQPDNQAEQDGDQDREFNEAKERMLRGKGVKLERTAYDGIYVVHTPVHFKSFYKRFEVD